MPFFDQNQLRRPTRKLQPAAVRYGDSCLSVLLHGIAKGFANRRKPCRKLFLERAIPGRRMRRPGFCYLLSGAPPDFATMAACIF